jgi:hypothetical protein
MQRLASKLFLTFMLLVPLLTACPSQGKDELKPVLTLTGEPARTVNTNNVLIEGTLQDNVRIASFSYSLNGGQFTDVMSSLQSNKFRFVVEGLTSGKNFISLVAADFSGNKNELISTIDVEITTADPTSSNPKIELAGGNYYQITTDHLILEGNVIEDDGVALFTYILDDNAPIDITNMLKEGNFTVELTNLKKGFNEVYFKATDVLGNTTELKVEVAAQFVAAPDITGLWGQQLTYDVCGSQEMALSFTFDKPSSDGKITGSSTILNFVGETISTSLTGYPTTPESIWLEITYVNKMTAQLYLTMQNDKLVGKARVEGVPTDWCEYGPTVGSFDISLNRSEILPLRPRDIAFEPNNDYKQAKEISSTSTISLFTPSGDRDWFKIKLSEKSLVDISMDGEAHLQISEPLSIGYSPIYSFSYSEPFRRILEAGSYYIKVSTDDCSDCVSAFSTFHITSQGLPDKNFEPNDTRETATFISEGSNDEFTVFARDQDWFKFTLLEPRLVTLNFTNTWEANPQDALELYYMLVKSDEESGTPNRYFYPVVRILSAGTYYLSLTAPYPEAFDLTFTLAPLLDVRYEPNNTRNEATPLTNGFSATMFLGAGDFCDIFTFTLSQPKTITLDMGTETFKYQVSYNDIPYWNDYDYEGIPLPRVYQPFTYYIKVCSNYNFLSDDPKSRKTYPVRFTVEEAP